MLSILKEIIKLYNKCTKRIFERESLTIDCLLKKEGGEGVAHFYLNDMRKLDNGISFEPQWKIGGDTFM